MFRLIVVTMAALYGVLLVFGDEGRRPAEVARAEPMGFALIKAAYLPDTRDAPARLSNSDVSDAEAIRLAIDNARQIRAERKARPMRGAVDVMAARPTGERDVAVADPVEATTYWYVTGSKVNIRKGPGTRNAVVGQVVFGTEAEVLGDADGWFEIRTVDGSASGWISSKFLAEQRPG